MGISAFFVCFVTVSEMRVIFTRNVHRHVKKSSLALFSSSENIFIFNVHRQYLSISRQWIWASGESGRDKYVFKKSVFAFHGAKLCALVTHSFFCSPTILCYLRAAFHKCYPVWTVVQRVPASAMIFPTLDVRLCLRRPTLDKQMVSCRHLLFVSYEEPQHYPSRPTAPVVATGSLVGSKAHRHLVDLRCPYLIKLFDFGLARETCRTFFTCVYLYSYILSRRP